MENLYKKRFLYEGYPELEKIGVQYYKEVQEMQSRVPEALECMGRLIELSIGLRTVVVVGCGPNPWSVKELLNRGYDALRIDPREASARLAAEFIGDPSRIYNAS